MNSLKLRRCVLAAVLPLFFLLQTLLLSAQQKSIDNALLWKVTGKSLLKPSFLFGTIHLQDQRVFNFNDSLYSFIKAADGFAMEIHPDSVVSALMQKEEDEESGKMLKQQLNKEEFNQLSRKLRKELGIDANKLTLKEAYLLKDHLTKPEPKADDMPTFVDAYLYGVARNQGKEIVGLEKAADQVNLLDDIKDDFDVRELLRNMKKDKTLTEKLVQLYIREDLQGIHNLMSYMPDEMEDKLLNIRNQVMVQKMDSLIQLKSFVVAVGTAHLPGKKGIIELLRERGYTVEPVFTTSRTHANNYAIKAAQKIIWTEVKEPTLGYSAKMPGKPSPSEMLNGAMKMNMYMDLSSMKVYYTAFLIPSLAVSKQNADSALDAMCKNALAGKGETISKSRFVKDGFEGIELVYKQPTDKMTARVQILAMGRRIYMIGYVSTRQDDIKSEHANEFFNSFTVLDMPENAWQHQTFSEYYFSISFPEKAKVTAMPVTDSSITSVQVSSLDNAKGTFYGLTINTATQGYIITNDSFYFSSTIERLKNRMVMEDVKEKDTTFQGFNARYLTAKLKDDLMLNFLMINRGNRAYHLTVITNSGDHSDPDIPAFFKSFAFTDYPKPQWHQKAESEYGFKVPVVSDNSKVQFLDELKDTVSANREYQWTAYDPASATSFYITRRFITPYAWVKHDSMLLKKYMNNLTNEDETLLWYKFVRNGSSSGIEFNLKKNRSSLEQRFRVLLNGPAVFTLQADVHGKYWNDGYEHFFEDFRFDKEENSPFLFTNSLQRLLTDLASHDSATQTEAYNAISAVLYDSTDIPALLKAASVEYPLDTLHYQPIATKLLDEVIALKPANLLESITNHYNALKPEQEKFKFGFLDALARHKTTESYLLIEKLLKQGVPTKGDAGRFVNDFDDSLKLVKKLYPYLLTLTSDTLMGTQLFSIHQRLLDSGMVKVEELKPYEPQLLKGARFLLAKALASTDEYYYQPGAYYMFQTLQALNTDSSKAMLRKFLTVKQINLKYYVVIALLKMDQPLDAAILQSIAADKSYRVDLYDQLKAQKKEKLFPAKYANQKSFAESYAFSADEEGSVKFTYVGDRVMLYNNKKYRFYLYKATYDDGSANLFISGGFSLDGKKIEVAEDITGVYWDEGFSQSAIDKQLKKYIADTEESNRKDEEDVPVKE